MKTNAVRLLDSLSIPYELREYTVDPQDLAAETVGAKIGLPFSSQDGCDTILADFAEFTARQ